MFRCMYKTERSTADVLELLGAGHSIAHLVTAAGGSPFPHSYVHTDSGTYRGQWEGNKKKGLGVYVYPRSVQCVGKSTK